MEKYLSTADGSGFAEYVEIHIDQNPLHKERTAQIHAGTVTTVMGNSMRNDRLIKVQPKVRGAVFLLCVLMVGCSHETWTTVEETSRLPSTAAPILAPVSWVAMAGRAATRPVSNGTDTERGKQFVLTRRVLDDFSSDGKFMEEMLTMQSRFRARDWGEIYPEQLKANNSSTNSKGAVGRFSTGSKGSIIIITDEGSEFKVRYEDEPEK
ncbi:MAG: hypothetical protein ACOYL3_15140 [Desulfuromonadaceae bacterium]